MRRPAASPTDLPFVEESSLSMTTTAGRRPTDRYVGHLLGAAGACYQA